MPEIDEKPKMNHTGAIKYSIIEDETGAWKVEYESSIENDIAALSIAQDLTEDIIAGISLEKKATNDKKQRKHLQVLLEKSSAARFGLRLIVDYMLPHYLKFLDYKKNEEI